MTEASTEPNYFNQGDNSVFDNPSHIRAHKDADTLLWNSMPRGEAIYSGIRPCYQVSLLCLKRCLRLAHRHASQQGLKNDENEGDSYFHGFVLGTSSLREDEQGFIVNIDRFDPGISKSDGDKVPSTPLPGDIIIPFVLKKCLVHSDYCSAIHSEQYQHLFETLHHQVSRYTPPENVSFFPFRLLAFIKNDALHSSEIEMDLRWVAPCISNSLSVVPINPVPIVPNALSKNLVGPLNISTLNAGSKTGLIGLNKSKQLVLLVHSDTKPRPGPTVGIWISGVLSVQSPVVWLSCMRYLHCKDIRERLMMNGHFLLVLYSLMTKQPLFFQAKFDDNEKLNFDLIYAEQSVKVPNECTADMEHPFEFRFDVTSKSVPPGGLMEREIFDEAVNRVTPFFVPEVQRGSLQSKPEMDGDMQSDKKTSSTPQSILRKNAPGCKGKASKDRCSSNGVSFVLHSDTKGIDSDTTPMPLPAPHMIFQAPNAVRPSVPELSIVFDDNQPAFGQDTQMKANGPRPAISGGLLNDAKAFTVPNRFYYQPDHVGRPRKPLNPQYFPGYPQPTQLHNHRPSNLHNAPTLPSASCAQNSAPHARQFAPNRHGFLMSRSSVPSSYARTVERTKNPRFSQQGQYVPNAQNQFVNPHPNQAPVFQSNVPTQQLVHNRAPMPLPVVTQSYPVRQPAAHFPLGVQASRSMLPNWMKDLPPQAYQLLLEQDMQLKQLRARVQSLLKKQRSTVATSDQSVMTEPSPDLEECLKVDQGTTMNTSMKTCHEVDSEEEDVSNDGTKENIESELLSSTLPPQMSSKEVDSNVHLSNSAPQTPLRCDSGQSADKYAGSDFASIHLDETNLREIATANNDDLDTRSSASSMKVDLPVLDTSTEQSPFGTPGGKPARCEMWDVHDSPVLGESASMCVVPPINLDKSLQAAEDKSELSEDLKDERFVKNLLDQVCGMLQNAESNREARPAKSNGSTPRMEGKRSKKSKLARTASENRVSKATKKQLRKMGVKLEDNNFASAGNTFEATAGAQKCAIADSVIPHLASLSLLLKNSSSGNICPTPSATDLSMHANAIALKYLSNKQLEEIACLSKQSTSIPSYQTMGTPNGTPMKQSKLVTPDQFDIDSKSETDVDLPGMSLVSPCNMSLATKRYMQKYGLIDASESGSDEDTEEDSAKQDVISNESAQDFERHKECGESNRRFSEDMRRASSEEPLPFQATEDNEAKSENGFSQLKVHLGDTLDMILPFLDDLDNHRQQTPSSDANHDIKQLTRSSNTGSPLTSENGNIAPSKNAKVKSGETKAFRRIEKAKENELSQILSPEILQAVAEYKKLARNSKADNAATHKTPQSSQRTLDQFSEHKQEKESLAESWPRNRFREQSEGDVNNVSGRRRDRRFSSPKYSDYPRSGKAENLDSEPVLTARVADAFREKNQLAHCRT